MIRLHKGILISLCVLVLLCLVVVSIFHVKGRRDWSTELSRWSAKGWPIVVVTRPEVPLPAEANATAYYHKAFELIASLPRGTVSSVTASAGKDLPPDSPELTEAMADFQPVYEQIYKGTQLQIHRNWQASGGRALVNESMPVLTDYRRLAHLINIDVRWQTARGDLDAAGTRLVAGFRLADHIGADLPMLVAAMVQLFNDAIFLNSIKHTYQINQEYPAELVDVLESRDYRAVLRRSLQGEGAHIIAMHSAGELPHTPWISRDAAFLLGSYHDYLIRLDQSLPVLAIAVQRKKPFIASRRITRAISRTHAALRDFAALESWKNMALVANRLRQYQLEHGAFPDDLNPLGRIPLDPLTARPFSYQRNGDGFMLTSVASLGGRPIEWKWDR